MSVAQDIIGEKYWIDGQPFSGVQSKGNDTGTERFWIDGQPCDVLLSPSSNGFFFCP